MARIYVTKQQQRFNIGDRVCHSELGRDRCKSDPDRIGTVTSYSRNASAVLVRFDGRKSSIIMHTSYLEVTQSATGSSSG